MLTDNEIKELTLDNTKPNSLYFGFNYYPDGPTVSEELFNKATEWVKTLDPSAIRFCNITPNGRIRYLANYSYNTTGSFFEGVAYIDLKDINESTRKS